MQIINHLHFYTLKKNQNLGTGHPFNFEISMIYVENLKDVSNEVFKN